ncbi:hypothetical protein MKZ38_007794 [Zalerion maritima]|uniref:RGS domain-containing protein n=1 Tax=Zalerion maritima TaxID=339359 RepID=A0AAD5RHS2_9PEZI|nr:hypothetical protein MKZ38_007794 [Zalerion maritima]
MDLLSLTYMRPSYVTNKDLRRSQQSILSEKGSVRSGRSARSSGIPDGLAFDNIIAGVTCSPLTLRDFLNFLLYKEHSAENLQFYLWYQDYVKRFSQAPYADLALAPEWTKEKEDEVAAVLLKEAHRGMRKAPAVAKTMFSGTDFEKKPITEPQISLDKAAGGDPFATPPQTPRGERKEEEYELSPMLSPVSCAPTMATYRSQADDAFAAAGAQAPFTIQPFRQELNRIVSTYIAADAPRQLNLSAHDRNLVLHALSYTTHPSAFRPALASAESTLRVQSHPNFVRWSTCNGCPPRIAFARTLGWLGIGLAFAVATVLSLSGAARGWRAVAATCWVPGIHAVVASHRGMCICMYTFSRHKYHVRPWELFADDVEGAEGRPGGKEGKESFDSFGSGNSFEMEPWVQKYGERNVWRKIFDKEARIDEPVLLAIHDTIFVQAGIVGLLAGAVLTAVFVAVPPGGYF